MSRKSKARQIAARASRAQAVGTPEEQDAARNSWLEEDKNGLKQTLKRKGISWAILELAQNSWDEDSTRVDITLTEPVNGKSTLTCRDNAPSGYADLNTSFVMFAPSYKKADANKRGRFNIGEKLVLALCHEASITSTSGQVLFEPNGKRRLTKKKTKAGSEFRGVLDVTAEEYAEVEKVVSQILCPIPTYFNGKEITPRKPLRKFRRGSNHLRKGSAYCPVIWRHQVARRRSTESPPQLRP